MNSHWEMPELLPHELRVHLLLCLSMSLCLSSVRSINTGQPCTRTHSKEESRLQAALEMSLLTDRNFQNLISHPWIPDWAVCQHLAFLRHSGQHLFVLKSSFSQASWSRLIAATSKFPHILGFFHTFQSVIQFQASISFSFPLICWPSTSFNVL